MPRVVNNSRLIQHTLDNMTEVLAMRALYGNTPSWRIGYTVTFGTDDPNNTYYMQFLPRIGMPREKFKRHYEITPLPLPG